MKRSSSEVSPSPISSPDQDSKPDITPSKKTKKSPTKPKKETGVKPENGEWDPEKRAVFMDIIIAAGYKAVNLDEIASTVSTTSRRVLMSSWEWERNNWSISLRRGGRGVSEKRLFWPSRAEVGLGLDGSVATLMHIVVYLNAEHLAILMGLCFIDR
jgi:hypothetical protein